MVSEGSSPEVAGDQKPSTQRRSAEEIRLELGTQREQLTGALADLRAEVQSARRIPMIIGGGLLAGIAAFVAFKKVRGRDDD